VRAHFDDQAGRTSLNPNVPYQLMYSFYDDLVSVIESICHSSGTLAISGPSINSPFSSTPPAFYHYFFTTVFSLHTSIITQARDSHTWPLSDKTPQHKIRKRRRSYSQGSSNGDSNFKKIWLHCGSRNNKSKGIEICKSVEPRQSKMFNRK
jgi:hypothetical protein